MGCRHLGSIILMIFALVLAITILLPATNRKVSQLEGYLVLPICEHVPIFFHKIIASMNFKELNASQNSHFKWSSVPLARCRKSMNILHISIFEWWSCSICWVKPHFCAGFNLGIALHQEIVTACKNGVRTVPLICDGYQPLKLATKEEDRHAPMTYFEMYGIG